MPPHVRARPSLRRRHAHPSPVRRSVLIQARLLRPRCDRLRSLRVRTFVLGCALKLDLGPDRLFHPLKAGAVDDQGAEPARPNFTPGGENNLHVMVGSVPMLSRKPRSKPARADVDFQLLHGRARNPSEVEPTPIVWRDDELVDRALAVFELAIASLEPLRVQTFGRTRHVINQAMAVSGCE